MMTAPRLRRLRATCAALARPAAARAAAADQHVSPACSPELRSAALDIVVHNHGRGGHAELVWCAPPLSDLRSLLRRH